MTQRIHPGDQLREEFMRPHGLSASQLAKDIGVPASRVQAILDGKGAVTGDTALRLARYLSTTPEFWLNMQRDYDLERAQIEVGAIILNTVQPRPA